MATQPVSPNPEQRIFNLSPYGGSVQFNFVVITPENTTTQTVQAAWAYALRYTAQGLDLPDHEAAINLLKERHPSWTIVESKIHAVAVNLALADQDEPENG